MFAKRAEESFPQREERILGYWQGHKVYQKSIDLRKESPLFSFYDGPPFATGLPHYGHLLAGTLKDVVPRYKTMKGFYVPRRFGWDCHGLPVENEIEKAKELSGAPSIEKFGIGNFNEECRSIVLRYTKEWERTVHRMGRWMDFSETYRTMDKNFMESVWWVFSELYKKGLVYEGFKVMPFSAQLGTPISNFEANLNYKEVDDPSLTVIFPLVGDPNTKLLAWTTTPWTLPSNLAVIVGTNLEYVKIKERKSGICYILAQKRLSHYFKNPEEYEVVDTFLGKDLKGKMYDPLFSYFTRKKQLNGFRVLVDDFVEAEEGTGIVHAAPAFGETDFFVCTREGIELVCPIDQNGRFTKEVPDYEGMFVKDADKEIIKRLKQEGRVFQHTQIRHRYPFCWRSDTPLIYKAVRTWFVAVEKIKDQMLAVNQTIHWVPENIKEGRFGKWLENARDWAISRNRYWGTPIPIWRSETGECKVIASVEELEKKSGSKVEDLHRHYVDKLTFTENGQIFQRIPEVFDCWFESGSMPYAQNHFPFENEEETMRAFPADFIAEGLDQTRGWFYTLTVLAVALYQKPAFKNVIVNGIILAEDGAKMSKRLKNYPEPEIVINQYGADAVRLYFLHSPVVAADDLKFSEKGVELVMRQALIPLWNSYLFLATYAEIYEWKPKGEVLNPKADVDRWILSVLQKLILDVNREMDAYQLSSAVDPFVGFIDQLTNWYIRRNRSRFWSDEDTQERREAFQVLYHVLLTLSQVAAPFIPFISEAIYQELREEKMPESVHLCNFPTYNPTMRDEVLEHEMQSVQTVVSAGHGLRKEHKLKVRQPLARAHIVSSDKVVLDALKRQKQLIADELNVKEIVYHENEGGFVSIIVKPNFRVLGKKVGKHMNAVQQKIQDLSSNSLESLLQGQSVQLAVEDQNFVITPEDVTIERKAHSGLVAASVDKITVALDTELSEALLMEGLARELVNKINTMRRDDGYAVVDRIDVKMQTTDRVKQSYALHKDYICNEVLAKKVDFVESQGTEWDLNGEPTIIHISLAN